MKGILKILFTIGLCGLFLLMEIAMFRNNPLWIFLSINLIAILIMGLILLNTFNFIESNH